MVFMTQRLSFYGLIRRTPFIHLTILCVFVQIHSKIHSENRNYTAQVSPKRKTYAINNAIADVYFELYCINWILLYVYTCFSEKVYFVYYCFHGFSHTV